MKSFSCSWSGAASPNSTALRAHAYVEETLRWLRDAPQAEPTLERDAFGVIPDMPASEDGRARILLADDNADMPDYVRRLLGGLHEIEAVPDGEAALAAIGKRRPDLVLTDVMMPRLDGFGLLAAIRGNPSLNDLPVIMLSPAPARRPVSRAGPPVPTIIWSNRSRPAS